jgi:hypothetical protein
MPLTYSLTNWARVIKNRSRIWNRLLPVHVELVTVDLELFAL